MPIPYQYATSNPPPRSTTPAPSSSTPSSPGGSSSSRGGGGGKWGPYSGAGDFTANMVIILISLFCAVVLAIALNAVIRHLLCALRHRRRGVEGHGRGPPPPTPSAVGSEKQSNTGTSTEPFPTLVFSAGTTMKLAGTEEEVPECSICLTEFVDGDRVRVLPACNHGFHVECVERWLASRKSCPTCRASCKPDSTNIEMV